MPSLLKPHARSKSKKHAQMLQRRLELWRNGDFDMMMREAKEPE